MLSETDWHDLHHQAAVVDLHAHPGLKVALFRRQLTERYRAAKSFFWPPVLRTDFAKLQEGGVDVLLSAVYVPEAPILDDLPLLRVLRYLKPQVWRELVEPPYFQASVNSLDDMEAEIRRHNKNLAAGRRPVQLASSVAELDTILAQGSDGPIAIVHTMEGGHNLQGEKSGKTSQGIGQFNAQEIEDEILANLQTFYDRGVALLTLAHFFPNRLVSPVFPFPEYMLPFGRKDILQGHDPNEGLTPLGETVVNRMLDLGIIIDITHCTPPARARVYQLAEAAKKDAAVIATHIGAYELNPNMYNLEDWEIRWIADHGGVVGVIFMNYWLMPYESKLGLKYISQTIEHFIQAAGSESVAAIGTDFDGMTDPPDDLIDASQMPRLTRQLVAERTSPETQRYTADNIRDILGRNALRVIREGWGKKE